MFFGLFYVSVALIFLDEVSFASALSCNVTDPEISQPRLIFGIQELDHQPSCTRKFAWPSGSTRQSGASRAAAAAAGVVAFSVLTAAAIGAAVGLAVQLLAPDLLGGMFDTPDYNVTQNAQAENDGIQLNKTGMLESIPVVYGTRKVGGKIVFLATNGTRNKYLYMALVLSEGEIESVQDIYINDVISTDKRLIANAKTRTNDTSTPKI